MIRSLLAAPAVGLALGLLSASPSAAAPIATSVLAPALGADAEQEKSSDEIERATEWPDAPGREALTKTLAKIKKATTDEMARQGAEEIKAAGAGAAPALLRALGKERDKDARKRLIAALDSITRPEHTRLLAKEFKSKKEPTQAYVLRRAAELGDAGLKDDAMGLWKGLVAMRANPRKKDKVDDDHERRVAILLMSCGSTESLTLVLELSGSKSFTSWRKHLQAAAECAKTAGPDVGNAIAAAMTKAKGRREQLGTLRLLTYAGSKEHARSVAPGLDSNDNNVKIAAINALRRLVDGDDPIEKLSTFDAIERANKWKARL